MSLGVNDLHNYDSTSIEELVRMLNLNVYLIFNHNANTLIRDAWDEIVRVWQNQDHSTYTDHGVNHSFRIVHLFLVFEKLYEYSLYEKLVFTIAALIHDIGMQYNIWAVYPWYKKFDAMKSDPHEKISADLVRKEHTQILFQLISEQINEKDELQNPGMPNFGISSQSGAASKVFRDAMYIACAHSGDRYLNLLIEESGWESGNRQISSTKQLFRPRLLAGLLRICDELDGTHARLMDASLASNFQLTSVSLSHWAACYLVEDHEIKPMKNLQRKSVQITLKWRSLENDPDFDLRVKEHLSYWRISKIQNEFDTVNKFYRDCQEDQHILHLDKLDLSTEPDRGKLNASIRDFVNRRWASRSVSSNQQNLSEVARNLENWYSGHAKRGHYRLINNDEHTDYYVDCRDLVSQKTLLLQCVNEIKSHYIALSIDVVLAIGTSAIPLATLVAQQLNCASSFIVLGDLIDEGSKSRKYTFHESNPLFNEGHSRLLIIDDILSGGSVVKVVLDHIEQHVKFDEIYFHAIFRLGDRKTFLEEVRIKEEDFRWIYHERNIAYFQDGQCDMCDDGGLRLIDERDMI